MFGNLGFGELLIIVLIIVILFGSKRIPDLVKGIGKGIREFRKASRGDDEDSEQK
jgi:sec-independent protein translocase protein TatA